MSTSGANSAITTPETGHNGNLDENLDAIYVLDAGENRDCYSLHLCFMREGRERADRGLD